MNKNFAHVSRTGFIGLNEKFDTIWPQLESDFEHIKYIQHERSKLWILSKAKKNKETKAYELPPETKDKINELVKQKLRVDFLTLVDTIVLQQHQVGAMGFVDMIEHGDHIPLQETQVASTSVPKSPSPKFVDPEIDIALAKI
ncbi:hypothetical protein R6Q57_002814 [Mikania cordata]